MAIVAASLLSIVAAADEVAGKCLHASVVAARDAARTMPKPAVVHLASGVHRLEKPLVLTPEDSGVTYVADGDVVISGARPVTGWRVEPDGTWSAPVPWVKADRSGGFRSMRVNGAMRPRARLPKKGHFTVVNDDLPQGATVTFVADRNVYFNPALSVDDVKFGGDRSLDAWRKMGKDVNSLYADPLFMDAAGRDFRLKPESPAFKTGFVDFDQSDIGQRKTR